MSNFFNDLIEQKLLSLHTCFVGKVIDVAEDGESANVQPLNLIKAVGAEAKRQAILINVPISKNAKKFTKKYVTVAEQHLAIPDIEGVKESDTVICVCVERDMTETRKGNFALPALGHHSLSDALIIGIL